MGLDVSHGCFNGAYSAFNRFRQAVVVACGGSFPPHDPAFRDPDGERIHPDHWYWSREVVPEEVRPGMTLFLGHSDCDGDLNPAEAQQVAAFLRWCAPRMSTPGEGHLTWAGACALKFAQGCEEAAAANETVEFG